MQNNLRTWRKQFCRGCKHKYFDGARRDGKGNPLCEMYFPVGTRCTFKNCKLKTDAARKPKEAKDATK
jgi:hypothetical protein